MLSHSTTDLLFSVSAKNLLLDLGGVLVQIDFWRMTQAFEKLGIYNLEKVYSHKLQTDIFDRFDKGLISEEEFRISLLQTFRIDKKISFAQFDSAWNQIIVDIPESIINCLRNLRKSYKLYLLSNTNSIHIRYLYEYLKKVRAVENFEELFDGVYYSFALGCRKPEDKIFLQVVEDAKVNPSTTLFIDDTYANIETAERLGFQVFLMPQGKLLSDIIRCY
ncbi:MAG: HAD family phosphatase [Bacteroidales bacterium]|nr:HAD family phosphatase [Bacteroidales bacterium]